MRTIQQLDEALTAEPLTAEQSAEVEAHYPAAHMTSLDSEKHWEGRTG
jgi:hypothetical protein